jgi:signal transduction histidine kinase
VEKLVALDAQASHVQNVASLPPGTVEELEWPMEFGGGLTPQANPIQGIASSRWDLAEAEHIKNLAAELLANRNLLAALAGPSVAVTIDAVGGAQPINLTGEDLTRILVNLVKNSAEAMPKGGRIQIAVREEVVDQTASVLLTIEDNGPGIPAAVQERIFESGYTSHTSNATSQSWPSSHRGLGLSITRSILEAAGGSIQAVGNAHKGACFEIHLPVRPTRA